MATSPVHFCTALASDQLAAALALERSLRRGTDGRARLTVLCGDPAAEAAFRALPQVSVITVAQLVEKYPPLAAARADRTAAEFQRTCRSWLLREVLASVPQGQWAVLAAPTLFFFDDPTGVIAGHESASVVLSPRRYAPEWASRERFGKYDAGLLAVRHDGSGCAGLAEWAERCARWSSPGAEADRGGEEKHLDTWGARFAGVAEWNQAGMNVAPWNLAGRTVAECAGRPTIDGEPLACFQFDGVVPVADGLFDPGLARWGVTLAPAMREQLFRPYLRELAPDRVDADVVPPSRADDPRAAAALTRAIAAAAAARRAQARAEEAAESASRELQRQTDEHRAREASTARLVHGLETTCAAQRLSLLDFKGKLEKAYDDILKDVETKKQLAADREALRADKDAQIANLSAELAKRSAGTAAAEREDAHVALAPYARRIRRAIVLKFHPRLLPEILWFAAAGIPVEVLSSPPAFVDGPQGTVRFRPQSMWDWLGQINSLFDEAAYLRANPDVAAAVASGALASGWEHYLRFGQREGRLLGVAGYCSGLAEFDAVAFDAADAAAMVTFLAGRLQPQNRLFVSGFMPPTDWLPPADERVYLLGDTIACERPPREWLGPRWPALALAAHLPELTPAELYPERPAQRAVWPPIAIVVPCWNQPAAIERTLRSVLDQNYPKLELIVVDGGSTDGSLEIIRRYAARLILVESGAGENRTRLLNEGLRKAASGLLAWLEPGDQLAPGSLFCVAQVRLLHTSDVIAGRCARREAGESSPREIHRTVLPLDRIAPLSLADLLDLDRAWLRDCFFNQPEVFFTRAALERAGGALREDLGPARNYDFWVRLAKAGATAYAIPEVLAVARAAAPLDAAALAELRAVSAAHRAAS